MPCTIGERKATPPFSFEMPWSRTSRASAKRRMSLPRSSMSLTPLSSGHSIKQVGVISDTHGLLRSEAIAALQGSDLIIHAGDIGKAEVLERLAAIAPVRAVRGNNDRDEWASRIPLTDVVEIGTL